MSETQGERWEWYIWRDLGDGGDRPWQVRQRTSDPQESELIAEHLIRVDAEQIVAAHNAADGGRERELREALAAEHARRVTHQTREQWVATVGWDADAGKTNPAEMIWRPPVVWCEVCKLLDAAPARTQTQERALAEAIHLLRALRDGSAGWPAVDAFLDALVAQAKTKGGEG